jgi:competence protein ComGC
MFYHAVILGIVISILIVSVVLIICVRDFFKSLKNIDKVN